MVNPNPWCDKQRCLHATGEVRRLPLSEGAVWLCHHCFMFEMAYRKINHPEMARPAWDSLEKYHA